MFERNETSLLTIEEYVTTWGDMEARRRSRLCTVARAPDLHQFAMGNDERLSSVSRSRVIYTGSYGSIIADSEMHEVCVRLSLAKTTVVVERED